MQKWLAWCHTTNPGARIDFQTLCFFPKAKASCLKLHCCVPPPVWGHLYVTAETIKQSLALFSLRWAFVREVIQKFLHSVRLKMNTKAQWIMAFRLQINNLVSRQISKYEIHQVIRIDFIYFRVYDMVTNNKKKTCSKGNGHNWWYQHFLDISAPLFFFSRVIT